MKTYKITASYITYVSTTIEAKSEEEAYQLAKNIDGGSYDIDSAQGLGDWDIYDVLEVTE